MALCSLTKDHSVSYLVEASREKCVESSHSEMGFFSICYVLPCRCIQSCYLESCLLRGQHGK